MKFRVFTLLSYFLLLVSLVEAAPSYNITATIDPSKKLISAHQIVTLINPSDKDLSELYFHVYPNREYTLNEKRFLQRYAGYFKVNPFPNGFESAQFSISNLVVNGKPGTYIYEGKDKTLLKVVSAETFGAGASIQIEFDFTVTIPHAYGRFGWHDDVFAISRWYPILSVYQNNSWANYPAYPYHRPFYSDAANYIVSLKVPEEMKVIHSGHLLNRVINDGSAVLTIESQDPIREFSMAMSRKYQVLEEDWQDIHLQAYYLPGREAGARKALASSKDLMAFYADRFGPYPYKDFSIAPVYLGYGGEQMSNMIYIDTRVFELPGFLDRYFDFLIAHETGHQWIYNLVGMDEYNEMWMEEGCNSYFIGEYLENKYGADGSVIEFPRWSEPVEKILPPLTFRRTRDIRYKLLTRVGLDRPVVGNLASFNEPSSIFSITYGKGSRIFSMLKEEVGKESFDKIFKRIFIEYRFKNLSIQDFKSIAEEESGKDLSDFFDQWLASTKKLDYSVEKSRRGQVALVNKGQVNMNVPIEIHYKDGNVKKWEWDGKAEAKIEEKTNSIDKVIIDPDGNLLDIDRLNNFYPRKFNLDLVPIYLPLHDISLFEPEDSYNIVVGPELANGGLGLKASFQRPYDYNLYSASDYEFSEQTLHSRVGFQLNNVLQSPTTLGVELAQRDDYKDGEEDLVSAKAYIRRELSSGQYGLFSENNHAVFYLLRNQSARGINLLGDNIKNTSYLKHDEAIIGAAFHFERSAPYEEPSEGYNLDTLVESSNHFWGATQYFNRGALDVSLYQPVTLRSNLALRLKYGGGFPDDKNLFELGGADGLRGYDRKDLRGANVLMGSLEYRFKIKDNLNIKFFDNIVGLDSLGGVVFTDVGQSWYQDIGDTHLKKDAGAGLRLTLDVGSFLEKVVLRADVAQAINDNRNDPHLWFGVNHAF